MLEIAGIIILGIFAQWIAWRTKVPAILPLIIFGLLVGPLSTLFTEDSSKLISPIFDTEEERGLFPGRSLFYFVSLAIGIILFEGGLTLQRKEIADVGPAILKLITVGTIVTFLGAAPAAHFLLGLSWPISFLFSGLIIVTGPTVIAPILQNIPLTRNVSTVLKWEGILIDPIGALVAVLVFEFINSADGGFAFTSHAFLTFVNIVLIGLALGAVAGYSLYQIIKRNLVPHYLLNVFILAYVLMVFVFSDVLAHESGLLTVVVMGMTLANLDVPRLKEILSFKEALSILLISILFILLAANINMEDLYLLINDWRSFALFGVVAFILRPIGVILSTRNSDLSLNEKLFISWVGPRGIVAAGIASLFGITLTSEGVEGAQYITPLVFMIVLGTVLINATTARFVARMVGVIQDTSNGVLMVGANAISQTIASYLQAQGRHVVLVDSNPGNIERTKEMGLQGIVANIYTDDLAEQFELVDMGYLLSLTSSTQVNSYAIDRYEAIFGEMGAFRFLSADELKRRANLPEKHILSYTDDFINFSNAVRESASVHELALAGQSHYRELMSQINTTKDACPLFLKHPDGQLHPIPADPDEVDVSGGDFVLVYVGKAIEQTSQATEPATLGQE
jgi:NhaP-type Na+/H+ or K+/H+ antiporter